MNVDTEMVASGLPLSHCSEPVSQQRPGVHFFTAVPCVQAQIAAAFAVGAIHLRKVAADRFTVWFPTATSGHYGELRLIAMWAAGGLCAFVLLPLAVLWATRRFTGAVRLRDCHVGIQGMVGHLWIYALLWAANAIVVIPAARTEAFQAAYPMYSALTRSDFDLIAFYALYALQFVAVEFFFRGYLLVVLRPLFRRWTIPAVTIPYVWLHLGKPPAEVVASAIAGLILGTVATRTKSIWGGVLVHLAVAATMDMSVLIFR